MDSSTGLVKFGTRYYNPPLGRWTQQDPVGSSVFDLNGSNRYVYASDDPVNKTDPSGETTWWDIFTQCVSMPVTGIIGLVGAVLGAFSTVTAGILAAVGITSVPLWVTWLGIIGAILFLGVTAFCAGFATAWLTNH